MKHPCFGGAVYRMLTALPEAWLACYSGLHAACLPEVWGLSPEGVGPHSLRDPVHSESNWGFVVHAQHARISSCLSTSTKGGLLLPPPSPLSVSVPQLSPTVLSQYLSPYPLQELAQLFGDLRFRFSPLFFSNKFSQLGLLLLLSRFSHVGLCATP